MEKSIQPSPRSIEEFMQNVPSQGPVVMLNLLRFREQAAYPASVETDPQSGRDAYAAYKKGVLPILQGLGARMLWMGRVDSVFIAPEGELWDEAFLVQYPSKDAFLRMIASPEYKSIVPHRMAALDDSRLIATTALS